MWFLSEMHDLLMYRSHIAKTKLIMWIDFADCLWLCLVSKPYFFTPYLTEAKIYGAEHGSEKWPKSLCADEIWADCQAAHSPKKGELRDWCILLLITGDTVQPRVGPRSKSLQRQGLLRGVFNEVLTFKTQRRAVKPVAHLAVKSREPLVRQCEEAGRRSEARCWAES